MAQGSQKKSDIEEHLPHQRLEWRLQGIGWFILAAVLLAAFVGFLGPGLLGKELFEEKTSGLRMESERFIHYQAPNELKIVLPQSSKQELLSLFVNRTYLDRVEIDRIEPEPEAHEIAENGTVYRFRQHGEGGTLRFRVQPTAFGTLSGEIRVNDSKPLRFKQFVYP